MVNSINIDTAPVWVLADLPRNRAFVFSNGANNLVTTVSLPDLGFVSQLSTGTSPQMQSYGLSGPAAVVDNFGNVWGITAPDFIATFVAGLGVWNGTTFGAPIHQFVIQTLDGSGSPIFPYASETVVNLPLTSLAYWFDGTNGHVVGICSGSRVSGVNSNGCSLFSINTSTLALEWYTTAVTSPTNVNPDVGERYPAIDPATGNIYLCGGYGSSSNWYFFRIDGTTGAVTTYTHPIDPALGGPLCCLFDSTTGHVWCLADEDFVAAFGYEIDPSTGNILSTVGSAGSPAFSGDVGGPTGFDWPAPGLINAIRAQNGIAGSNILLYNASSIAGDPTLSYFSTALAPTQNFDLANPALGIIPALNNTTVNSFGYDPAGFVYMLGPSSTVLPPAPSVVTGQYVTAFNTSVSAFDVSLTLPNKMAAGNSAVVFIGTHPATITSVTDDAGNTYSLVSGPDTCTSDGSKMYMYACQGLVGTPQTVTVAVGTGSSTVALGVEVTAGGQIATVDEFYFKNVPSRTETWTGTSISPSQPDALLLGFAFSDSSSGLTMAAGGGFTQLLELYPTVSEFFDALEGKTVSSSGFYAASFTNTFTGGGAQGGLYTLSLITPPVVSSTLYAIPLGTTVPNIVGETSAAGAAAVIASGLITGVVTTVSSRTVAAGLVISQSPAAGSSEAFGSAVDYVLSRGLQQEVVFNVQDPSGQPIAFGELVIKLSMDISTVGIGGQQIVAGRTVRVQLDVNGSATVLLWPNDVLYPLGSTYLIRVYTAQGQPCYSEQLVVTSS
jgi:hypothetical protein